LFVINYIVSHSFVCLFTAVRSHFFEGGVDETGLKLLGKFTFYERFLIAVIIGAANIAETGING